jgi:DNA topoisomerase I
MLIVIESPNKIKKIKQITGANVIATVGHFKDLPTDEMGIDLETYQPTFRVSEGKADVVKRLREAAKGQEVIIASDPDREGYAIGTMVYEEIKKLASTVKRAEINEITEKGVKAALAAAIPFDRTNRGLYNAFLGRRVGDRLVGYILSPIACTALHGKYSVGRVQSPAVRLVVEREREIRAFISQPFWTLEIFLEKDARSFKAFHTGGKFTEHAACLAACVAVQGATTARVLSVETAEKRQNPKPPFTTVDLQATANSQLKIAPERTMQLAQQLFEAGLISYHRTDSVKLADEFIQEIRAHVAANLGEAYLPRTPVVHKSKNSQAEAHEAIRPTGMHSLADISAIIGKEGLTTEHERLYALIFRRAVASQLSPAVFDATTAIFNCAGEQFKATGKVQKFPGFLAIYAEIKDDEKADDADQDLPALASGEDVTKTGELLAEKKTKPPGRFTEGSLVKELERLGIGRPSTFASIMGVIKSRGYVAVVKGKLEAAVPGEALIDHLSASAPWAIEYEMTRKMEVYLDRVEIGEIGTTWQIFAKTVHGKMGFVKPAARNSGSDAPPSPAALKYAQDVAAKKGVPLPVNAESSATAVRAFLDKHATKATAKTPALSRYAKKTGPKKSVKKK